MKENGQYLGRKRVMLEAALRDMFLNGYDSATIQSVAEAMGVDCFKVVECFGNDDFLRISAIHYAAESWCVQVKAELGLIEEREEKFRELVSMFVNGSKKYSHSLRLYVNIWERLTEQRIIDDRVKTLLNETYNLYQELFCSLFAEWYEMDTMRKVTKISSLAWIMVVISDGLFVQQLFDKKEIQIKEIGRLMYEMALAYVKSEGFKEVSING